MSVTRIEIGDRLPEGHFQHRIERHLDGIEKILSGLKLGGFRLTLVAYIPGKPNSDVVLTRDSDSAAIRAVLGRMFNES